MNDITTTDYTVGQELVMTADYSMGSPLESGARVIVVEVYDSPATLKVRPADDLEQTWFVEKQYTAPVDDGLRRALGEAEARLADRDREVAELRAERTSWEYKAAVELARFKDQVRDAAIAHAVSSTGHCREGLNDWLTDVGLDPVLPDWRVTVQMSNGWEIGSVVISGDDAEDEESAIAVVRDSMEVEFEDVELNATIRVHGSNRTLAEERVDYEVEGYLLADLVVERLVDGIDFIVEKVEQ